MTTPKPPMSNEQKAKQFEWLAGIGRPDTLADLRQNLLEAASLFTICGDRDPEAVVRAGITALEADRMPAGEN